MRAANDVNLRMAPLTPDHHFYIDQGANAHVRLVLVAIGRKLAALGAIDDAEDVMFLRYNELRALIGDQSAVRRQGAGRAAQGRAREGVRVPTAGVDRHCDAEPARLPVSRQLGLPGEIHAQGR